jgi:class 3 adenylate cyclase/tetratricopeptide (TPR) repeat protein
MQCSQCQHANRDERRFCAECGVPLAGACSACGFVNEPGEKFCGGCGILLTASALPPPRFGRDAADTGRRFHALLRAVLWTLQRESRVTYRELKHVLDLDDALLEEIRQELDFKRLARDEQGQGLVWTGVPSNGPAAAPEVISADTSHDEPAVTSEAGRSVPDAERRQLTVMFCDLADSTKLSRQLDPEDLREVVRAYQATAAEVIHRYEGHIAQYLGDGVLVYFGWPTAHEDDAQRALHAGLGIVDAVTMVLNPRLERDHGVQLTVRLGVHTGSVVVGDMGGRDRREHLATGDTVNIAARLEALAAPNTVVLSGVTARLVREAFALSDLGPQTLKGVAEPLPVFRVLGLLEAHEAETGVTGVPFLVGRDEEVGLLRRRWEQSKSGLGQVVLISGEAGIGKSSLVAVVRRHVREEGHPRITFRCSPYHTNSALYPVLTHLEHLLRFDRDDPPATKLDKLEQVLRTTSLAPEESLPLLATLLSIPATDRYPAPAMSPQQQRQQTLDTLVGWLLAEAERHPVLAVWEDLHWIDPSTLELLGLVLEQTPTVPMLHLLTFRPEFTPPWPARSHMTPMTLNRLERPQVEALLTHLARGKSLPPEVVEHIVTKTDGVPLYVEELTRMLLDSELLREESDRYVLTGPLTTVSIPDTLQDSLMARLDQLQAAKEAAQMGAVLGREFSYEMLRAIASQDEETLQTGLAQLVEAELLYQRGRPPRAKYIFKHALIQDTAYQSLLRSTRQQVHARIAQVLEAQFPETVEAHPELLAQHYTRADLGEHAINYWQRAGQRANLRYAYMEAVQHFSTAVELLRGLPETPERLQQELTLSVALGPALVATAGHASPAVLQVYSRARELCQRVAETPQLFPVLFGLWRFYLVVGEMQTDRELAEQLLRLARQAQDTERLCWGHSTLAVTLYIQGELSAAGGHFEQALRLSDSQHHHPVDVRFGITPEATSRVWQSRCLWNLGYPDRAVVQGHEAIALAQAASHPYSLAAALGFIALVHQLRLESAAAQERAEASIALATEHGFPLFVALGTTVRGWALAAQGEREAGLAALHEGLEASRSHGAVNLLTAHLYLAEAYNRVGQADKALHLLTEALHLVERTGIRYQEAELYRLKGENLLAQVGTGRKLQGAGAQDAAEQFQKALDIARNQQAKSWELRAATSLACLWHLQGKRQEAYELLAPVYGWFTEGFDTADLKDAKALLDELAEGQ